MPLSFGQAELDRMKRIEQELVAVLLKYRDDTEAALPAFALVRCARTMLRLYPKPTQQKLTRVVVDFLEGKSTPRDDRDAGLLIDVAM